MLALEPEIVVPSQCPAIVGKDNIKAQLTKMRDAIVYVHEAVLKGMNDGKDVHTLMEEIKLPPELDVGEGYGKISWSVRGMYESYVGWFSGDAADGDRIRTREAARPHQFEHALDGAVFAI
ncbi:MAG: hypothetical protein HC834_00450 [Rhodospirillales bacterium]|nr:hypothetical protein [Rhodospirillales bacterium]